MICMTFTRPAEEAGRWARLSTVAARAGTPIRRAWRANWDWRARKVTILILQSLDCRTLHDIGVAPSEIKSLVYGSNDRRRRYDVDWLWRNAAR